MNNADSNNCNMDTVIKWFQHFVKFFPDREALIYYNGSTRGSLTFQQLYQLAGKFAFRLRRSFGFKRYDVIANTLPNSPERLVTDLGILLAGCLPMNGQILLSDGSDFFQSARNSRCTAAILCPDGDMSAWRLMEPYITRDSSSDMAKFVNDKTPDLRSALLVSRLPQGTERLGESFLEDLRTSNEDIFVEQDVTSDDLAVIFTTSGSTGYSKLVPHDHKCIVATYRHPILLAEKCIKFYNDRPLGWMGGYPHEIYLRGKCRIMLDRFDSHGLKRGEDIWRAITQEKCLRISTILPLDAEKLISYVDSLGDNQHRLERVATGGQPLRNSQINALLKITDEVLFGYASTESGPLTAALVKGPGENMGDNFCGKVLERASVRVVDEKGEPCKPKQVGSLHAKGTLAFKGYFNRLQDPDPQTLKAFTKDGWLDMEDNGYFDEEGNLYVLGRTKDIIMYGGVVLYPGWLEAKIQTHPEVFEACVVPVSDPVLHHNICACVEPITGSKLTEDSLRTFCESIFVADIEDEGTPAPKFFLVMENMPQLETGKCDRKLLKTIAEEKFGIKSLPRSDDEADGEI